MTDSVVEPRVWSRLRSLPSEDLHDARLQLHWACQLIAAAGAALAEPQDDDSHRGFQWVDGKFAGAPLVGRIRVTLSPADLVLALQDAKEVELDRFALRGHTLPQARSWLEMAVGSALDGEPPRLELPDWDMPQHTVGHGADFTPDPAALEQLAAWYANADLVLSNLGFAHPNAGSVRGWPHHFDVALLVELGSRPAGPETVGVGMTPGDQYYAEPYWYVSPWPYPSESGLPELSRGRWHTNEWVGAVLTFAETVEVHDPGNQQARVVAFLEHALATAMRLPKAVPGPERP